MVSRLQHVEGVTLAAHYTAVDQPKVWYIQYILQLHTPQL